MYIRRPCCRHHNFIVYVRNWRYYCGKCIELSHNWCSCTCIFPFCRYVFMPLMILLNFWYWKSCSKFILLTYSVLFWQNEYTNMNTLQKILLSLLAVTSHFTFCSTQTFLTHYYNLVESVITHPTTLSQKTAPTLISCSFNKHGLILIIFGRQHQHTLKKMICLFNIPYPSLLLVSHPFHRSYLKTKLFSLVDCWWFLKEPVV